MTVTSVPGRSSPQPVASSGDPIVGPLAPPPESAPKEIVDSVPEHFGATALPNRAKLASPVPYSAAEVERWPDALLEHQTRALHATLNAPANYPGREVDAGNLALVEGEMKRRQAARTAPPVFVDPKDSAEVRQLVKEACHEAEQLGHQFTHDAPIRKQYVEAVAERAKQIVGAFERGEISAETAAAEANKMRNEALGVARAELSPAGKVLSSYLKEQGLTLEKACEKYAGKLFGRPYSALTQAERSSVLLEVAKKAGVTNAEVNALSQGASKATKVLFVVTVAIALYQVASAEDKAREGVKQAGGLAGAWAGAKLGALAGTSFCGLSVVGAPGAPACAVIGGLAGALGGALLGEHVADAGYRHATRH